MTVNYVSYTRGKNFMETVAHDGILIKIIQ